MADVKKKVEVEISATDKASSVFASLMKGINAFSVSVAAVAGAAIGGAFVSFMTSSAKAAAEEEDIMKKLERQLGRVGIAYGTVNNELSSYFKNIQNTTRFSDDEAASALTELIQKTGDYTFSLSNLGLVTDIAAARGESLTTVAEKIGRAYNGNLRGIREYGASTKDLSVALEQFRQTYGGEALADAESYAGKWRQIGNLWEELKETAGKELLPLISDIQVYMKEWLQDEKNLEGLRSLATLAAGLAKSLISIAEVTTNTLRFGGIAAWSLQLAGDNKKESTAGPFGIPGIDASSIDGFIGPLTKNITRLNEDGEKTVDIFKKLGLTLSTDLNTKIKEMTELLASTQDPVLITQLVTKLHEANVELDRLKNMRDLVKGLDRDGNIIFPRKEFSLPPLRQLPDGVTPRETPREFDIENDPVYKALQNLERVKNLVTSIGVAFESRMTHVFGRIRSMADLAAFKIKDVFQALGDAILDILAQIAAKMAAIGLLNIIGEVIRVPGLGGILGSIFPAGGGTKGFHGGSGIGETPPIVQSTPRPSLAPVYVFNVQGSVVTERELMQRAYEYQKKVNRYGQ